GWYIMVEIEWYMMVEIRHTGSYKTNDQDCISFRLTVSAPSHSEKSSEFFQSNRPELPLETLESQVIA
ncbi:MAG: hypothetical protein WCI18_16610, partial [Pseudomonadota bacterium]